MHDFQEELDVGAEGKENVLPFGDLGSADVTEVKPDSSSSTRVKPGKISKKVCRREISCNCTHTACSVMLLSSLSCNEETGLDSLLRT